MGHIHCTPATHVVSHVRMLEPSEDQPTRKCCLCHHLSLCSCYKHAISHILEKLAGILLALDSSSINCCTLNASSMEHSISKICIVADQYNACCRLASSLQLTASQDGPGPIAFQTLFVSVNAVGKKALRYTLCSTCLCETSADAAGRLQPCI